MINSQDDWLIKFVFSVEWFVVFLCWFGYLDVYLYCLLSYLVDLLVI